MTEYEYNFRIDDVAPVIAYCEKTDTTLFQKHGKIVVCLSLAERAPATAKLFPASLQQKLMGNL